MMKTKLRYVSAAVMFGVVVGVGGCAPQPGAPGQQANGCSALGPKALTGALLGAATGAGIGALAGRGRGALIGGLVGAVGGLAVGASIDRNDCIQAQMALNQMYSAPIGRPLAWNNTATGSYGSYTPVSGEFTYNGEMCRRTNVQTTIAGRQSTQDNNALSCRMSNGDYHVVDQS